MSALRVRTVIDPNPLAELIQRYPPGLAPPIDAPAQTSAAQSAQEWLENSFNLKYQHEGADAPVAASDSCDINITTLMICDIPCRQTVEQIIAAIDIHGFAHAYNLVYMPSKRPKYSQNLGYAFVNFKTPEYATGFAEVFKNFQFPNCSSMKMSYTKPARCQGYEQNLDRYSKQRTVGCLVADVNGDMVSM